MVQKLFVISVCLIGFTMPVGLALVGVGLSSMSMSSDSGLPDGFQPVGALTVYYVGGG